MVTTHKIQPGYMPGFLLPKKLVVQINNKKKFILLNKSIDSFCSVY